MIDCDGELQRPMSAKYTISLQAGFGPGTFHSDDTKQTRTALLIFTNRKTSIEAQMYSRILLTAK